jgi:Fructose/tagatose bisphosphate aldolase
MPIANLKPFLDDARANKYALGCFNVFNIETLEGVIEAAVNMKTPVVCAVYEPQLKYSDLETFSSLIKDVSNKVNVPVVLHLDHAEEISSIVNAIKCGFTSLMFDGPKGAKFEEKVEKTKKVVEIAHSVGLMVEAELGYITRVGVDEAAAKENIADPNLVQEFVEKTGIDILAPAIGSIHGLGEQKATLDLDLLRQIKEKINCYLSLHGGSGVDDRIVGEAIDIGINKVSVYTRISNLAIEKMKKLLEKDSHDLAQLMNEARNGFREMVEDRLKAFRCRNICTYQANVCNISFSKYDKVDYSIGSSNPGSANKYYSDNISYDELVKKITGEVIRNLAKNR